MFSCLKRALKHPTRDPLWWTICSEDGWWQVSSETADKMKENLRWRMSGAPGMNAHGGNQRAFTTSYWSVAGCPPCLKSVTPQYYDGEKFSEGESKWYAHDIYWQYPPQTV